VSPTNKENWPYASGWKNFFPLSREETKKIIVGCNNLSNSLGFFNNTKKKASLKSQRVGFDVKVSPALLIALYDTDTRRVLGRTN
jgi:hypothetical protein